MKDTNDSNGGGTLEDIGKAIFKAIPLSVKVSIGGTIVILFLIIFFFMAILSPVIGFQENLSESIKNQLSDEQKAMQQRVNEVYEEIAEEYGVKVDRALLYATALYGSRYESLSKGGDKDPYGDTKDPDWLSTIADGIATFSDTWFHTAFTKEGKELKTFRTAKKSFYKYGIYMINGNQLDLGNYKARLIDTIIPDLYHDYINEDNKEASIRQIANNIFSLADVYRYIFKDEDKNQIVKDNCLSSYGDILVNVTDPSGNVLAKISFSEYLLGVTYGEVTGWMYASNGAEFAKAFYITVASYTLAHAGYKPGMKEFSIRSSTQDQVWCDVYKGCWSPDNGDSLYPGSQNGNYRFPPVSKADLAIMQQRLNEVAGIVRMHENGTIMQTFYASNASCNKQIFHKCYEDASGNALNQDRAYQLGAQGKTYEQILNTYYKGKNGKLSGSGSSTSCLNGGITSTSLPIKDNLLLSKVTSSFGPRIHPITGRYQKAHGALDFGYSTGTPIYAIADGTVMKMPANPAGYGNYVVIGHDLDGDGNNERFTLYAHMSKVDVKAGQKVTGGMKIGEVGSTGNSTGPHLHFEYRMGMNTIEARVDPEPLIQGLLNHNSEFDQAVSKKSVSSGVTSSTTKAINSNE